MMVTKIEVDEFELDKAKFLLDVANLQECNRKVKTRESRVYFDKLEKQATRVNKAKNACQATIDRLLSFSHAGADSKKIWTAIQKKIHDIKLREGLVNTEAVSVIAIANCSAPALLTAIHQKVQSSIMGAVVNEGDNNIGLVVQPVWASTKQQVFHITSTLLQLMENNNVTLDLAWSLLFENKCDERDERPLNYPGRFCLGKNTERGNNHRMKTDLVSKGYVQVEEQLRTRAMVEMADSSEEALPNAQLQVHQKQSEKYNQLGVLVWGKTQKEATPIGGKLIWFQRDMCKWKSSSGHELWWSWQIHQRKHCQMLSFKFTRSKARSTTNLGCLLGKNIDSDDWNTQCTR